MNSSFLTLGLWLSIFPPLELSIVLGTELLVDRIGDGGIMLHKSLWHADLQQRRTNIWNRNLLLTSQITAVSSFLSLSLCSVLRSQLVSNAAKENWMCPEYINIRSKMWESGGNIWHLSSTVRENTVTIYRCFYKYTRWKLEGSLFLQSGEFFFTFTSGERSMHCRRKWCGSRVWFCGVFKS